MEKIGVGVIGVGVFGDIHAKIYSENRLTKLVAVADVNEDRAKHIARKYGAKPFFSAEELLKDPNIKAVSIVVPDAYHKGPCIGAAESKKHILLEKPLATTVDDAVEIVEAARKNKVKLMVDFMVRWNPAFSMAKESVDSGEIGQVQYINIKLSNSFYVPTEMLSWADKSSVLWFLGSHTLDQLLWLVDSEISRVFCVSKSNVLVQRGVNTPDYFKSIIEFKNGVIADMENSWILPNTNPTLLEFKAEIVGSEGKIDVDAAQHGALKKANKGKYYYPDVLGTPVIDGRMYGFAYAGINHFIECVVDDKEPNISPESSLEVTRILTKLEESAKKKQFIEV